MVQSLGHIPSKASLGYDWLIEGAHGLLLIANLGTACNSTYCTHLTMIVRGFS